MPGTHSVDPSCVGATSVMSMVTVSLHGISPAHFIVVSLTLATIITTNCDKNPPHDPHDQKAMKNFASQNF